MRRVGEIMEELGFREGAPEGVQKAFIKNLVRAAYGAEVEDLNEHRESRQKRQQVKQKVPEATETLFDQVNSPGPNEEEQLSFQFMKKNG